MFGNHIGNRWQSSGNRDGVLESDALAQLFTGDLPSDIFGFLILARGAVRQYTDCNNKSAVIRFRFA